MAYPVSDDIRTGRTVHCRPTRSRAPTDQTLEEFCCACFLSVCIHLYHLKTCRHENDVHYGTKRCNAMFIFAQRFRPVCEIQTARSKSLNSVLFDCVKSSFLIVCRTVLYLRFTCECVTAINLVIVNIYYDVWSIGRHVSRG